MIAMPLIFMGHHTIPVGYSNTSASAAGVRGFLALGDLSVVLSIGSKSLHEFDQDYLNSLPGGALIIKRPFGFLTGSDCTSSSPTGVIVSRTLVRSIMPLVYGCHAEHYGKGPSVALLPLGISVSRSPGVLARK